MGRRRRTVELKYCRGHRAAASGSQDDIGRLFERADAQDKFLTGAAVQVADNWGTQFVHRQYDCPELTPATRGETTVPM